MSKPGSLNCAKCSSTVLSKCDVLLDAGVDALVVTSVS